MSTYAERKERRGDSCVTVWLSKEAMAALESLVARNDKGTKRSVIEHLLLREARLAKMLTLPTPAEFPVKKPPPKVEQRMPEARAVVEPGSPADLARRVLDKGPRREAVVVRTGKRVSEGRERR